MSDLYWLTDEQMERLRPHFPKSHGRPRVDDRRVLSGIIFVNRNGLRWRDAPAAYGPHKTLYNRWKRWSEAGVFIGMVQGLSGGNAERRTVMIEATASRSCSAGSRIGGAWPPDTIAARPSSCQPSLSPLPCSSGYEA